MEPEGCWDMPDGAVAWLGVEGGGKEPLASLSSVRGRVWGGVLGCTGSEGAQGSGSRGSREGAWAHPRQVELTFSTMDRSRRDKQMAYTAEFGHPPGSCTA